MFRAIPVFVSNIVFAFIAALLFLPAVGTAQQASDTLPAQLVDMSFTPNSIDVTGGPATVTVTWHVTDDLAGVSPVCCSVQMRFESPSRNQFRVAVGNLQSGTTLDGTWIGEIAFPQFSEGGSWTIASVSLFDLVGNHAFFDTAQLQARGMATTLNVTSIEDVTPPQLIGFGFAPATVDTSLSAQYVTFDLGVMDGGVGVSPSCCGVQVRLESPSGQQWLQEVGELDSESGTWKAEVRLPRYSEAGTWVVRHVYLADLLGNTTFLLTEELAAQFPVHLEVFSDPSDTTPPQVANMQFTPHFVDTSAGAATVNAEFHVTDNLAGVTSFCCPVQMRFRSPSGNQSTVAVGFLEMGTPTNGIWRGDAILPQFSEAGTWVVDYLLLFDELMNLKYFSKAELETLGFATELVVFQPSQVIDGSISDPFSGGTVADDTFGDRAQVTVPGGVFTESTQVTIDVFEEPLDVPLPQGFSAPGTNFVNIELIPQPAFPLPSPGLTIVLPLVQAQPAGTLMVLYRFNTTTAQLEPALDWSGQPVVGMVDAPHGLSATFPGIGRLSTVVAFVPGVVDVQIDVKPGSSTNAINSAAKGVVPVAVLTTDDFNASFVDPATVTVGGVSPRTVGKSGRLSSMEDVDRDGDLDLLVHVDTEQLGLAGGATELTLKGETIDGRSIQGRDSVRIVP
jgi:hypothetical protein